MEEKNLENVNKGNNTKTNKNDRKNFSIAGFCLGIISIVICCTINISMIIGILAIIFGGTRNKIFKEKNVNHCHCNRCNRYNFIYYNDFRNGIWIVKLIFWKNVS